MVQFSVKRTSNAKVVMLLRHMFKFKSLPFFYLLMLSPEVIILDKEIFIGKRKALGYSGHLSVVTVLTIYEHNATMIRFI